MANVPAHLLVHRRLEARNQLVAILRIGIPALGLIVLAGLAVQIYVASFTGRFGIGRISVSPEAVTVDAPEYAGILEDGSAYRVWAETALARAEHPDLIDLTGAHLVLNRPDGVQMQADAIEAQLDTINQLTLIPGLTDIADSTGTTGTLTDSVFDWEKQVLTANGPVVIDQADGTTVRAEGLVYDAAAIVWTFSRSVVTLPATPGENPGSGD